MPPLDRVKRRVLREAVRENLALLRGFPPLRLPPRHPLGSRLRRGLLLVLAPAVIFLAGTSLAPRGLAWRPGGDGKVVLAGSAADGPFAVLRPIDPAAFPLGVKKIVLDPGHGGHDVGAGTSPGLWEKDLTLDVARRLRALLREASFDVAMTRDADESVSLRQRAAFANAERADLFVSIHVNSVPTRDCHAVETYYLGQATDARGERLAGAENRESGYSLADFRRLLEGVYTHVRQTESRKLAELTQRELVKLLEPANPAVRDLGVKSAPFLVLVATESPGILAEVSCLASDDEARLLGDGTYRQKIARGLLQGIHAYAEARNRLAKQGADP